MGWCLVFFCVPLSLFWAVFFSFSFCVLVWGSFFCCWGVLVFGRCLSFLSLFDFRFLVARLFFSCSGLCVFCWGLLGVFLAFFFRGSLCLCFVLVLVFLSCLVGAVVLSFDFVFGLFFFPGFFCF